MNSVMFNSDSCIFDDDATADDTAEQQQQVDAAAAVRDAVVAARSVRSSNCERTYNSYHIWRVT